MSIFRVIFFSNFFSFLFLFLIIKQKPKLWILFLANLVFVTLCLYKQCIFIDKKYFYFFDYCYYVSPQFWWLLSEPIFFYQLHKQRSPTNLFFLFFPNISLLIPEKQVTKEKKTSQTLKGKSNTMSSPSKRREMDLMKLLIPTSFFSFLFFVFIQVTIFF